ncbi:MAG: hypothetical protein M0Q22_08165 [Sulfuritalea sp.]|jgi:hypothetical protein|nr:hypothetical protein [Sulfuritalea sp.]
MFLPKAHFKDAVARTSTSKTVDTFKHDDATCKNILAREISEDALATLDCGIFCPLHEPSKSALAIRRMQS